MALKILVVDDAVFIRDLIKKQLRDHIPDLELFEAADGARGLALFKQNLIDVILSDWEMPVMTGEEFLVQVRTLEKGKTIPFIMVTSRGDREHVVKAVQLGVSDYITKPFTPDELHRKLYKQLKVINKLPALAATKPAASANPFGGNSLGVLTGTKTPTPKPASPVNAGVSALLGGAPSAKLIQAHQEVHNSQKPVAVANAKRNTANLRFADNKIFPVVIREMSLQVMSCTLQRSDRLPELFEQTAVDIDMGDAGIARLNAYIHSITAGENRPDSNTLKIIVRFVDNDATKFEQVSKFIATL